MDHRYPYECGDKPLPLHKEICIKNISSSFLFEPSPDYFKIYYNAMILAILNNHPLALSDQWAMIND